MHAITGSQQTVLGQTQSVLFQQHQKLANRQANIGRLLRGVALNHSVRATHEPLPLDDALLILWKHPRTS